MTKPPLNRFLTNRGAVINKFARYLSLAYLQLPLDEASQEFVTVNTQKGPLLTFWSFFRSSYYYFSIV